jgi:hypothetical protein
VNAQFTQSLYAAICGFRIHPFDQLISNFRGTENSWTRFLFPGNSCCDLKVFESCHFSSKVKLLRPFALCLVPGVSYENVTWMLFFEFSYSAPVLSTHSVAGISRFDFSNWYIWFEIYNAPLENDVSLICDASNFSCTPVIVFWAMKWNHYEVYVA